MLPALIPVERVQLCHSRANSQLLALTPGPARTHLFVDSQARALRAVTQAGGAADAADTARPQRIEEVAAVAAASNLFAGEPRYDPAADPFAQLATFDRSALIAPGFDSRLLTFSQGRASPFAPL